MTPSRLPGRLMALTLLATLLFMPPLISLFDRPGESGMSLLPLYLFCAWGLVVLLAALLLEGNDEE